MAFNISQKIGALTSVYPADQLGATVRKPSNAQAPTPGANLKCRIRSPGPGERDQLTPPISPCRSPSQSPCRSPCRSPVRNRSPVHNDLVVACQALASDFSEASQDVQEKEHLVEMPKGDGVPVYVMLPLDTVRPGGGLNRKKAMWASLMGLKKAGVEGVMVDVWWGMVEKDGPGVYNWNGYTDLMEMAKQIGLKVQAVMSFHQCGGNVGDSVTIPLPRWAVEEMEKDPDLCYTDQWGHRNYEYVSLGCDTLPVLKGRSPVQCYADFMRAFRDQFASYLGTTIIEVQAGMGPAGELRYPSYPESNGTWKFPGIGAFQCYDKYMISSLKAAALSAGKSEWGHSGPTDAGGYNSWPEDTNFFRKEGGGWNGPYGEFFLSWYSQLLLDHGERILSAAFAIFSDRPGVKISAKVSGIHWHYGTRSHAPELTAGYYNTRFRDGYLPIARMLARHGAVFNFTCLEMRDYEQPGDACCRPEALVKQVAAAAKEAGAPLAGENALPRYDESAHGQIANAANCDPEHKMVAFTYLRLNPQLFEYENWRKFVAFVEQMKRGKDQSREALERKAEQFVQATSPLVQEAGVALMSG